MAGRAEEIGGLQGLRRPETTRQCIARRTSSTCAYPITVSGDLPVMAHEFGHVAAAGLASWDARGNQALRPVLMARFVPRPTVQPGN